MDTNDVMRTIPRSTLIKVKNRAFDANFRAKVSSESDRDAFYREKHSAINFLLEKGCAFVDSVDWYAPDPIFGVTFVGGGRLHVKVSVLTTWALHSVRRQLDGQLVPNPAVVARGCYRPGAPAWN